MTEPPRLNASLLAHLDNVKVPAYSRDRLQTGMVHIGLGAFHRAHQAMYTERVLNGGDLRWGIVGASLRSTHVRDALAPQDYLYTVCARGQAGFELQVPGGLVNILTDADSTIAAIADPKVRVVTLTITEKGYQDTDRAGSAVSTLANALARRMESRAPLSILSCDNLTGNGRILAERVLALCEAPGLTSWVRDHVAFPRSMVDRITPRATAADRDWLKGVTGYRDASPVLCESFSQWVIEDDFRADRPEWEVGGAQLVKDVAPYERAKLRLLNLSHSLLAYLGLLNGYETIHEAVGDAMLRAFVLQTLEFEVKPHLKAPPGLDVDAYIATTLRRFGNDAVPYRTAQVASDGSHKLPQRLFPTLKAAWAAGEGTPRLELALCAWLQTLKGKAEDGTSIAYSDPGAEPVRELLRAHADPEALIQAVARETTLWPEFPRDALLRMGKTLAGLTNAGISAALTPLLSR